MSIDPVDAVVGMVVLADLHLMNNDPLGRGYGVENTRTQRKLRSLEFAAARASSLESSFNFLVLAGDIFDAPRIDESIRRAYCQIIRRTIDAGVGVIHVAGNHPRVGAETPLASEHEITVDDHYVFVSEGTTGVWLREFHPWRFFFVPFQRLETLTETINGLKVYDPQHSVLVSHFPVRGSYLRSGVFTTEGIDPTILDKFQYAFLGDIHRRQEIKVSSVGGRHHFYVGSAVGVNFGEYDYPHSMAVVIFSADRGTPPDLTWVPIEDDPMLVYDIDLDQGVPSDLAIAPKSLVKITFRGKRSSFVSFPMKDFIDSVYDRGAGIVRYESDISDDPRSDAKSDPGDVELDPAALVRRYASGDKDRERVGLEILESQAS